MCIFHEVVARDIATPPGAKTPDPARYSVARVVLARYHLEQYMPQMADCSGCCNADMTTPTARAEFAASGLARPMDEIIAYRDRHIDRLHRAMERLAAALTLTPQALNLPADVLGNNPFIDEAVTELLDGYTGPAYYAAGPLRLKARAHKPEFEALRAAAATLLEEPGLEPILKQMMENSIARLFIAANDDAALPPATERLHRHV